MDRALSGAPALILEISIGSNLNTHRPNQPSPSTWHDIGDPDLFL